MATDVVMPQMGESIAEGTIVRWIKKVGDAVDRDEPLFEISTDKVDAEIPSPVSGFVLDISVQEAVRPLRGTGVAADALLPFLDGIDEIAKSGATAIVQPGGSVRDEETIAAADEHDLAMVFTGVRHFKH